MDSIGQIFQGIGGGAANGGTLGTLGKVAGAAMPIVGTVSNWIGGRPYRGVANGYNDYFNQLRNTTPQQEAAGIQQLQQPLSTALTQNVGNVVQANMAERGLSQSPGIFASALAQALAPYSLQQQQLAQQAYFTGRGLPGQMQPGWALGAMRQQPSNLAGALQNAAKLFQQKPNPLGLTTPAVNPDPTSALGGLGIPGLGGSTTPTFDTSTWANNFDPSSFNFMGNFGGGS